MKNLKIKKIIASLLIAVSALALNPVCASAEWKNEDKGLRYTEGNSYLTDCWKEINGEYYYFSKDGYMVRNEMINTHVLGNNGALMDKGNIVKVGGITFIYPFNWSKETLNGKEIYYLDDKGTNVTLSLANMQGKTIDDYINTEESKIKNHYYLSDNTLETEYDEYNHNIARLVDYSIDYDQKTYTIYHATFFNKGTAYIFTLIGDDELTKDNVNNFKDLLKTVEFAD